MKMPQESPFWRKWSNHTFSLREHPISLNVLRALPFWVASLLTGLIAVGFTKLFGLCEHLLKNELQGHYWIIFLVAPVFFLLAWAVVQWIAPGARGSGIPQVMAAIDLTASRREERVGKLLSLRILITKIVSSLLMVLGGGAIGREGPTIQIAGSVFHLIQKWTPASWPKASRKSFILTGAAAGLAAAFNTPLGGLVFAMEELARMHLRYFRTALFTAVIIAGLTAQGLLGPYLYLGYPDVRGLGAKIFLGVALVAALAGGAGALMSKVILRMMKWKKRLGRAQVVGYVIATGLIMAALAYFVSGEILGSGKEVMNQKLFSAEKHSSALTVLMRIIGPVLCFNTGAAGGIFAPALSGGAVIGSFISGLFDINGSSANILILSGMVAFLTGVTRTPFTSAILVLEMTDRHSVIFHLLIAALIANGVALLFGKHSLYEILKKDYLLETEPVEKATAVVEQPQNAPSSNPDLTSS